ncbi:MAG: winged helix-turn-helix domain-containing protein, partial [Terriglobales bacterium]
MPNFGVCFSMGHPESERRVARFGAFEVDLREGRLTKGGIRIKLQGQPFQILALLLDRPAQLVSRDEIRQRLWSEDTFVEFDDGLNTAVRKLRAALGDPAENPRFVETVPRRGYRFIAPVSFPLPTAPAVPEQIRPATLPEPVSSAPLLEPPTPAVPVAQPKLRATWLTALLSSLLLVALV